MTGTPAGDLSALVERLEYSLEAFRVAAPFGRTAVERERLEGKAEGVRVALGYVRDHIRRASLTDEPPTLDEAS